MFQFQANLMFGAGGGGGGGGGGVGVHFQRKRNSVIFFCLHPQWGFKNKVFPS